MMHHVPLYLGFQHISRESVITEHTTQTAKVIFGDGKTDEKTAILVLDGTYIYIQKSRDYSFARRSFSLHKGRPLVKPMMIVTTTGENY